MNIVDFINAFRTFCRFKYGKQSGTATSYANALKYLLEYLNIKFVDKYTILTIRSIESDISDKSGVFYGELYYFFAKNERLSYLLKGFVKASIKALYDYVNNIELNNNLSKNDIILDAVTDSSIVSVFDLNKTKKSLPTSKPDPHSYNIRKVSGTISNSINRIYSGRKAEKYFISYLETQLGLKSETDFIDVSNNKDFGYDIRLFEYGIEVKNIKSGGFYLTDNEIARLLFSQTHLIFVDIDNGIWLLKNNSVWLKNTIADIQSIRDYCLKNYSTLDLSDICICLDASIADEAIEISSYNKNQVLNLLK